MNVLRRRWRLFVGIAVVVAAIVVGQLTDSTGVKAGLTVLAILIVIILVITGTRPGGGGPNPWLRNDRTGAGGW